MMDDMMDDVRVGVGRPFDYCDDNSKEVDNMYMTERAHARGRRSNLRPQNSMPIPGTQSSSTNQNQQTPYGSGDSAQIVSLLKQVLHEQQE